ncbi:WecB/TagA/CpsF family glycosyltransferase [Parvularcula sp. ZS-1/3]|uniref:WecB/TagA/CpsF family glycosyltransferase n=1 Tax=Parvularcula mediterranea TaxID=2732508 RepID=A0A7Y3RM48_9PROT|nr:WecB/TagA/CpsF family glycosyltransferase [Parvularcula mediterranea]NNU16510.1 WecB/TagA/CpsF family glycosyltransferase [Parvularcula mediterranea]
MSACAVRETTEALGTRTIELEGIKIANASKDEALEDLRLRLDLRQRSRIMFMNAHCFNVLRSNPYYATALRRADVLLPDGSGVAFAARMKQQKFEANLNGTDLVPALFDSLTDRKTRVFLLGGTEGVAEEAAANITADWPDIDIVGTRNGYFAQSQSTEIVKEINATDADIVLVAMGVPQQELWIDRHGAALEAPMVLAVGGLFDFLAERVSRAPTIVRRTGMEWGWRMMQEPSRLWRRYVIGNPVYLSHALADGIRSRLRQCHDILARGLDIVGSAAALLLAAPILLPAMLAVKLTSPGPVFFRQERVGKGGRLFQMLKLRSMVVDAETRRAEVEKLNHHGEEAVTFKIADDPRITPVGKFIRRYSIDELPQLINVLQGDMALVGPRPPLPEEAIQYSGEAWVRLSVKPGITCFWQVGGRASLGFREQVRLDLQYIRERDLVTDIEILAKTPLAVITAKGAY